MSTLPCMHLVANPYCSMGGLNTPTAAYRLHNGFMATLYCPTCDRDSDMVLLTGFMTAYDLAASREIQLMLLTMMEDDNAATSRAAALVSAMGVDAALMDVMAVPTLGRQCLEGLRALRDSLGLSPAQSAA